jgi:arsenate reductase
MRKRVLFLCTGNSCRSQLAEAIVNARMGDQWEAFSAGVRPAMNIQPYTLKVLEEWGINHQGKVKGVEDLRSVSFDLVVTVCDTAAEECPVWFDRGIRRHIDFPDPAKTIGSEEEILRAFRQVRDDIARKIPVLLYSLS